MPKSCFAFSRPTKARWLKLLSFKPPVSVTRPILYCFAAGVLLPDEPQAVARTRKTATTPNNLNRLCPILDAPFINRKSPACKPGADRSVARIVHLRSQPNGARICLHEPPRSDRPQARRKGAFRGGNPVP